MDIHFIVDRFIVTFISLEGLTTLVLQQREGLVHLHQTYASWFYALGPLSQEAADAVDPKISGTSSDGRYLINFDNVKAMLEDMGNFH